MCSCNSDPPGTPQDPPVPDPLAELQGVGHGGAEQDDANVVRQHDQHLLPHHASLGTGRALAETH